MGSLSTEICQIQLEKFVSVALIESHCSVQLLHRPSLSFTWMLPLVPVTFLLMFRVQ